MQVVEPSICFLLHMARVRTQLRFRRLLWERLGRRSRLLHSLGAIVGCFLCLVLVLKQQPRLEAPRKGNVLAGLLHLKGPTPAPQSQPTLPFVPTRFLTYAPHSGLANQFMELVSAFDVARVLNRTLVVPPVLPHFALKLGSCEQVAPVASAAFLRQQNRRIWEDLDRKGTYIAFGDIFDLSDLFAGPASPSCRVDGAQTLAPAVAWERRRCSLAGAVEARDWMKQAERSTWAWPFSCHEVRIVIDVPHGLLTCADAEQAGAPDWIPPSAFAATWRMMLRSRQHVEAPVPQIHGVCEMLHNGVDGERRLRDEPVIALGSVFHFVNYAGTLAPWTGGWQLPLASRAFGGRLDFMSPRLGGRYGYLAEQIAEALLRRTLHSWRHLSPAFVCVHLRGGDGAFRTRLREAFRNAKKQHDVEAALDALGLRESLRTNRLPVMLVTDMPRSEARSIQRALVTAKLASKVILSSELFEKQAIPATLRNLPFDLGSTLFDLATCSRAQKLVLSQGSTFSALIQALQRTRYGRERIDQDDTLHL